jgi:hypothetical protein
VPQHKRRAARDSNATRSGSARQWRWPRRHVSRVRSCEAPLEACFAQILVPLDTRRTLRVPLPPPGAVETRPEPQSSLVWLLSVTPRSFRSTRFCVAVRAVRLAQLCVAAQARSTCACTLPVSGVRAADHGRAVRKGAPPVVCVLLVYTS